MHKLQFTILAITFLALVGSGQKIEDDLNLNSDERNTLIAIEKKCFAETNADRAEVEKFDKGEFADNKPLRCFYKCLLYNFGVMDEQGRIVHSKIALLVPDKLRAKAEHCFNVEKGEFCDVAYDVYKCYIKSVYHSN